jgi:hypothetical protein
MRILAVASLAPPSSDAIPTTSGVYPLKQEPSEETAEDNEWDMSHHSKAVAEQHNTLPEQGLENHFLPPTHPAIQFSDFSDTPADATDYPFDGYDMGAGIHDTPAQEETSEHVMLPTFARLEQTII